MANTIQSVGRSLFNLISRVLISPIHLLAAIWFTIVTPFPAAKNPIFIKFVIPRKIRDFIYVGISLGHPPHASWVVNWLRKQAGGYIHMRYTPTSLLPVLWAVRNVCHLTQQPATSAPLALSERLGGLLLCFTGVVTSFLLWLTDTWNSFLNLCSPLPSLLLPVWLFSPFLSYTVRLIYLGGLRPNKRFFLYIYIYIPHILLVKICSFPHPQCTSTANSSLRDLVLLCLQRLM